MTALVALGAGSTSGYALKGRHFRYRAAHRTWPASQFCEVHREII